MARRKQSVPFHVQGKARNTVENGHLTPTELRTRRNALGLSAGGCARMVGLTGAEADRTVRRWERGDFAIPGPVRLILDLIDTMPCVRDRLLTGIPKKRTRSENSG